MDTVKADLLVHNFTTLASPSVQLVVSSPNYSTTWTNYPKEVTFV